MSSSFFVRSSKSAWVKGAYLAQDRVVLVEGVVMDEFPHLSGHGRDLARSHIREELEGGAHLLVRHDLVHVVLLQQLVDGARQENVNDLEQADE